MAATKKERKTQRADGGGRKPWYGRGLRFECLPECGRCCTLHDDYAYVYLEGDDLSRLAAHLGLSEAVFRRRYTSVDDGDIVLKMDQPDCPFLDGWRCGVYDVRPTQCRTFPFWPDTLGSRAAWNRMRRFCPGIGEGELHTLKVIRGHLASRESD